MNWHMLVTSLVMWLLITINFGLSWSRIMDAFVVLRPGLREDPGIIIEYFADLAHWKEVARTGVYVGLTAVADTLFIYRCYVIWGRSIYIIALPILLLCCSITAGIGIEVVIGTAGATTNLFATSLATWAQSFFAISLVQNVLTTFLIVYRIWRVNIGVTALGQNHSLWPVMAVVLESGAVYSSTLLLLLMTYVSGSFAQYIALDMLVPIIGIVFNLIIVRVGLGLSSNSGVRRPRSSKMEPSSVNFRTPQNLSINVSRHVTVNRDLTTGPRTGRGGDKEPRDDFSESSADGWKLAPVAV